MDRAEEIARSVVEPYRVMFREDAQHLTDGLIMVVAWEIRSAFLQARLDAISAAEKAVWEIRQMRI